MIAVTLFLKLVKVVYTTAMVWEAGHGAHTFGSKFKRKRKAGLTLARRASLRKGRVA
jgi:hypothetical protein